MGIQGLIPFLEKASAPANVSEFSGKTVVIDAYCWLHKGAFSCAEKLARGDACDTYVHYCMKFVNMLLSHRIKPILVFDGQKLPAKAGTEKKRKENRELNRKKAAELMRMDRGKEAQTYLRRCVDITHEMALQLIHACRSRNVDCIVAPYEADAQLAFLNINGIADVIVTEDSDLLLFGAKRVLFKMDMQGNGLLVEQEKLHLAMDVRPENFSFDKFRYMCILSGCDYLPSLPGIGLVKARRFINRTADPDIHRAISRMSAHLNMPQLTITNEYRDSFMGADFMFKYQPVFDPFKRRIVPLNSFPDDDHLCEQKFKELLAINGLSDDQICNLAYGNLDPFTLARLDNWEPGLSSKGSKHSVSSGWNAVAVATHPSIWSENYIPNSWNRLKPKVEPPNALSTVHSPVGSSVQNNSTVAVIHKPSIKTTHENVDKAVKELKSLYACDVSMEKESKEDGRSLQSQAISPDHSKKTHHNPWMKNISKINSISPASKQNVGALSKFASLCKTSSPPNVESRSKVISRYFSPNITSSNENTAGTIKSETQILQATYSVQHSPQEINSADSGSFCERSPLKDQNVDDNDKLNASPSSPDLNKSISAIRKRLNPFAVKNPDKKYRTVFPLENNATAPKKSECTFKWSEKVESNFVYDVTARNGSANEFKQPRKLETENDENVSLNDESTKLTPEQDNEDEGFCSPSVENAPKSPFSKKLKCRSVGLTKKPPLKQKSLKSMFAFKRPSKLKL